MAEGQRRTSNEEYQQALPPGHRAHRGVAREDHYTPSKRARTQRPDADRATFEHTTDGGVEGDYRGGEGDYNGGGGQVEMDDYYDGGVQGRARKEPSSEAHESVSCCHMKICLQ